MVCCGIYQASFHRCSGAVDVFFGACMSGVWVLGIQTLIFMPSLQRVYTLSHFLACGCIILMKILFFFGMIIVTFLKVFLELKPLVKQMQNGALALAFKSSISWPFCAIQITLTEYLVIRQNMSLVIVTC